MDSDIRVFYRRLWEQIIANEVVAEAGLVDEPGTEGADVLKGEDAVILLLVGAKTRNVAPIIRESAVGWSIRKEELDREPVLFIGMIVNISIELVLAER